jgi:hypothetical protein
MSGVNVYLARWLEEREGELGAALAAVDRIVDTEAFEEAERSLEVRLLEPGTHGSCGSYVAELVSVPHVYGPDDDRVETRLADGRNETSLHLAVRTLARRLAHLADRRADSAEASAEHAAHVAQIARGRAEACSAAFDAAWPDDKPVAGEIEEPIPF